ncbi:MAG TPA: nitrogenase molybdenum-iron protein [Lachnospiraceae bacterium]|nr:nitrogenase molybdenum-iron protein [Lachnospiraceae bacterium]
MKGLHKIIFPFAPDQSGAVSVFYDLGGMIVICDAGGCAGNICGFDEPRWFQTKSAVFSAGLRDMDAILGRDDLMIRKMEDVAEKLDLEFAAVIGTPVPATIATDYQGIKRLAEKKIGLPVITVPTNGIRWYDEGAERAYLELFRTFAADPDTGKGHASGAQDIIPHSVGVIGATPLDLGGTAALERLKQALREQGAETVVCYGAGASVSDVRRAGRMEKNLVVAPSGLKAARYLQRQFGTPYTCGYPIPETVSMPEPAALNGKRVLIVHQQIRANALREYLRAVSSASVDVASWFLLKPEGKQPGDFRLREEDQFRELMAGGTYDVVFADPSFRRAARGFQGVWVDLPHFAVSGVPEA